MTEQTPLVHTGIIAAAGSAARMWPASKVFPKELFPLGRIPVLVHVIQEMVAAGIRKIVIVVRPDGSNTIQMMLDRTIPPPDNARGDAVVREFDELLAAASFSFVPQSGRYGNGTPLLDGLPSTDGGPLVYAFADDIVIGENASAGLIRTFERTRHPVLAAQQVPDRDVSKFGILEYTSRDGADYVTRFVEKPAPGQTTSRFASLGRYLVTRDVVDALEQTPPGRDGELWLSDAFGALLHRGSPIAVHRLTTGQWYTVGNPDGYADAVAAARQGGLHASGSATATP